MENSEKVFTELTRILEKKCSEVKELISAQEKAEIDRAEDLHRRLDQELAHLRQRDADIVKLLNTDDQVHFLKVILLNLYVKCQHNDIFSYSFLTRLCNDKSHPG